MQRRRPRQNCVPWIQDWGGEESVISSVDGDIHQQLRWRHAECFRDSHEVDYTEISFPALDTSDIGTIQATGTGESLLGIALG